MIRNEREHSRLVPYLAQWWRLAFGPRPLPEGEVRMNDVFRTIQYELLAQGFRNQSLPIPEPVRRRAEALQFIFEDRALALKMLAESGDFTTAKLFAYEEESEAGKLFIHFTGEEGAMALRKTTAKVEKEKVAKVAKAAKEKVAKRPGATSRVLDLLLEKKYTDEDIVESIRKEYPDRNEKQIKVYISCQRGNLNSGRSRDYDAKKSGKIERIGGETKPEKKADVPTKKAPVAKKKKSPAKKK